MVRLRRKQGLHLPSVRYSCRIMLSGASPNSFFILFTLQPGRQASTYDPNAVRMFVMRNEYEFFPYSMADCDLSVLSAEWSGSGKVIAIGIEKHAGRLLEGNAVPP